MRGLGATRWRGSRFATASRPVAHGAARAWQKRCGMPLTSACAEKVSQRQRVRTRGSASQSVAGGEGATGAGRAQRLAACKPCLGQLHTRVADAAGRGRRVSGPPTRRPSEHGPSRCHAAVCVRPHTPVAAHEALERGHVDAATLRAECGGAWAAAVCNALPALLRLHTWQTTAAWRFCAVRSRGAGVTTSSGDGTADVVCAASPRAAAVSCSGAAQVSRVGDTAST